MKQPTCACAEAFPPFSGKLCGLPATTFRPHIWRERAAPCCALHATAGVPLDVPAVDPAALPPALLAEWVRYHEERQAHFRRFQAEAGEAAERAEREAAKGRELLGRVAA